jgi:hypothetical protein
MERNMQNGKSAANVDGNKSAKSEKKHLEILVAAGNKWIFKFTPKGLSKMKNGEIFEKKMMGSKGPITMLFVTEEVYKRRIEPILLEEQKLQMALKAQGEQSETVEDQAQRKTPDVQDQAQEQAAE